MEAFKKSGVELLTSLARTNLDVADMLLELREASNDASVAAAHRRLEILVPPWPPGWSACSPRYSRVDATIASRTVTQKSAFAIYKRRPRIQLDSRPVPLAITERRFFWTASPAYTTTSDGRVVINGRTMSVRSK